MSDKLPSMFEGSPLITEETWEKFVENAASCGFVHYVHATAAMTKKLEQFLNSCNHFDELKAELSDFVSDRKMFVFFAADHLP